MQCESFANRFFLEMFLGNISERPAGSVIGIAFVTKCHHTRAREAIEMQL